MTEATEIAIGLGRKYIAWLKAAGTQSTGQRAREYVRMWLPEESEQMIDNVAEELHNYWKRNP